MKLPILTLLGFCLAISLQAQGPADNPPATKRTPAELDELLGPIALYPDALIALILPASTVPSDVVLGARYVASGGDPARAQDKSWDSSVKALTRYPDTLKWLDENLEWTTQVGDAFIEQPVEVMESIQQLRAKARELGNLVDTPQQRIVQDDTDIRIIPAQPDYIFEPRYDPDMVYYERPSAGPFLFFSSGYGIGSWLDYDFDWRHHRLYRGEWHQGWDYSRDRDRRDREDYAYINNNLTNSRVWRPDPARHRSPSHHVSVERAPDSSNSNSRTQSRDLGASGPRDHHVGIARPNPIAGAPRHRETIRRAEQGDGGTVGNGPSPRTAHDGKPGDGSKGRVVTPKSEAPKMSGEGKEHVIRHAEPLSKKEAEAKAHGDTPRHESAVPEDPKHREALKHEETPKHQDTPKHEEPKHRDAPKHEEAPKHQETPKHEEPKHRDVPKHEEAPKHQDAPKREEPKHQDAPKHEAPKHEEAKPHADAPKDKGKKKDDDKDKK